MGRITDKIRHAWNAFRDEDERAISAPYVNHGAALGYRPHRTPLRITNEKSIIGSIYNRIGIDVSAAIIRHVKLDEDGNYKETVKSGLNECFTVEANVDQPARAYKQDIAMSMFDKGVIALVPIDTTLDPAAGGSINILTMRVGEVVAWYPRHVRVSVYDDREDKGGVRREITLSKSLVAIVENPLYTVMNEPNSTLQRLIRKLNLLDRTDEENSAGKLDLIVQLPYTIKSPARREQAEIRRKELEFQLRQSEHGIGYTDATEKIVQLNRPVESKLQGQIEYLTALLYSQLGLTKEVFDGTADEATMLNYRARTIEPILDAITESLTRTFITKTARTQGQAVRSYNDPFKLVPVSQLAEVADKFTRNEIASSNEIRAAIGMRPSKDPKADELHNSNIPRPEEPPPAQPPVKLT